MTFPDQTKTTENGPWEFRDTLSPKDRATLEKFLAEDREMRRQWDDAIQGVSWVDVGGDPIRPAPWACWADGVARW